jgi:hypothetical protein
MQIPTGWQTKGRVGACGRGGAQMLFFPKSLKSGIGGADE